MALSPAKSLGEKLCDATPPRCAWSELSDVSKATYERVALAFAANLSFDEQTQAAIDLARSEGFAQGRASLEERVRLLEGALAGLADLYDTDEGCRSLPQYVAASALLATSGERENGSSEQ